MDQLGDQAGALRENEQALAMRGDDPHVLNTQCFVLAELGRGHDVLPYCEHAVQLAPDVAAAHEPYEVALAGDHQCDAARRERAIAQRLDPASVDLQRPINCRPR